MKKSADLILLHGALGGARDFDFLLPALKQHYQCHVLDLPGHGTHQFASNAFNIPAFADYLLEYIQRNKLDQPKIFGFSMGGYVATHLQATEGVFDKIYTLGTKFIWDPASAEKEAALLNPQKIIEKVPAYAQKLESLHGSHWKLLVERTAQLMLQLGNSPALVPGDYMKIQIPVAVGIGDADKMIPLSDAVTIKNQLPHACLDVLPFTPHPLDRVDPKLLLGRLRYFFEI